jgi:hypothetical protein
MTNTWSIKWLYAPYMLVGDWLINHVEISFISMGNFDGNNVMVVVVGRWYTVT